MKKSFFILITVILLCLYSSQAVYAFWIWTPKTKKLVNPKNAVKDTPEEQFKWATKLYEQEDYKRAAEEFASLAKHFKESDLAPEAQYHAGLSYEKAGKPYPAFKAYQKTIDLYPFTKRIDDIIKREYDIGQQLYKKHAATLMGKELMTELDRAVEIFETIRKNSPFGDYSDKAQFMVAMCYKKSEQYTEAISAFQALVTEYRDSPLYDKARYEIAQCTYLASLNPDYDQELTDEAIKEFRAIADSREGLAIAEDAERAIATLKDRKAASLYKTAEFYERQKHYKSAEIYYNEVLSKYPDSSSSDAARERLAILEEMKTGEPRKSKKWLFF